MAGRSAFTTIPSPLRGGWASRKIEATRRYGLQPAGVTQPAFIPPPSLPVAGKTFVPYWRNALRPFAFGDPSVSFPPPTGFLTGRRGKATDWPGEAQPGTCIRRCMFGNIPLPFARRGEGRRLAL